MKQCNFIDKNTSIEIVTKQENEARAQITDKHVPVFIPQHT